MIDRFIEYLRVERRYSELTALNYERDLREFCSFLHVETSDFDPTIATTDDVRMWLVQMMDNGLTPRSVRRKLSALRSFYKYLLRIGKVEIDITRSVVAPKMNKPLPSFFSESEMAAAEELMRVADDFPSVRDNLIIEMLYETGMRRAEIVGLSDGDIDMSQMQIRIFGKRRKERIVPFGDRLRQMIFDYYAIRQEEWGVDSTPSQTFFLTNSGAPMTVGTLYNIVRTRMGEASTQKKHSPHVLRHTFATDMLANGADINTIKTLMGHASLAATQVYTHTTFQQLKDAYKNAHPRAKS